MCDMQSKCAEILAFLAGNNRGQSPLFLQGNPSLKLGMFQGAAKARFSRARRGPPPLHATPDPAGSVHACCVHACCAFREKQGGVAKARFSRTWRGPRLLPACSKLTTNGVPPALAANRAQTPSPSLYRDKLFCFDDQNRNSPLKPASVSSAKELKSLNVPLASRYA